jgi:Tat protein secretion system quality control protein TatD with DNase activity
MISVACYSYANRLEDLSKAIEQCLMIGEIGFDQYYVSASRRMEQNLPRLQHRAQISGFIYEFFNRHAGKRK